MSDVKILQQEGHNFLWIDGVLWMWDLPDEVDYQIHIARQAYGDVLVAGYGFGLVQRAMLKLCSSVDSVTTIELYHEVFEECRKIFGEIHGKIIIDDFHCFCDKREGEEDFDCVIGDIWSEIALQGLKHYERFMESAEKVMVPNGKVLAWGQEYFEFLITKRKEQENVTRAKRLQRQSTRQRQSNSG